MKVLVKEPNSSDYEEDRQRWASEVAEIDWNSLNHAYGSAKDVSVFLSGIVSNNESDRESAFSNLYSTVLHQGSIYTSTKYVVEVLSQLFEYSSFQTEDILCPVIQFLYYAAKYSSNSVESECFETIKAGIFNYMNIIDTFKSAQIIVFMYRLIEVLLPYLPSDELSIYIDRLLSRLVMETHWRPLSCLVFCVGNKPFSAFYINKGSVIKSPNVSNKIISSLVPFLRHEQLFIPLCVSMMLAKFAPSDVPEEGVVIDTLVKGITEYKKSAYFAYDNLPMTDSSIMLEICLILLKFKDPRLDVVLNALLSISGNDALIVVPKLLEIVMATNKCGEIKSLEDFSDTSISILTAIAENDNLWEISGDMELIFYSFGFKSNGFEPMQNTIRSLLGLAPKDIFFTNHSDSDSEEDWFETDEVTPELLVAMEKFHDIAAKSHWSLLSNAESNKLLITNGVQVKPLAVATKKLKDHEVILEMDAKCPETGAPYVSLVMVSQITKQAENFKLNFELDKISELFVEIDKILVK